MKRKSSIHIKAAVLLVVFALNTIVGFACAIGIDMGYNSTHHHSHEAEPKAHVHKDGSHHHHTKHATEKKDVPGKDDCCTDNVVKISQIDKTMPQTAKFISPVFVAAFAATYYSIDFSLLVTAPAVYRYSVSAYHPPGADIRIAIQSFQI